MCCWRQGGLIAWPACPPCSPAKPTPEPVDSADLGLPQKLLQTSWQPCHAPAIPAAGPWGPAGTAQHHKSSCSEASLHLTGCWQAFSSEESPSKEFWWRVRVSFFDFPPTLTCTVLLKQREMPVCRTTDLCTQIVQEFCTHGSLLVNLPGAFFSALAIAKTWEKTAPLPARRGVNTTTPQ